MVWAEGVFLATNSPVAKPSTMALIKKLSSERGVWRGTEVTKRLLWCAAIVFAVATVPALTQSQFPAVRRLSSPPDAAFLEVATASVATTRGSRAAGLPLTRSTRSCSRGTRMCGRKSSASCGPG